ncbi:MAG TPA: VCBS repeat-containing protein [Planctomycetes bacterium]|nr:VCBS repeat-containing protein [Planctomycetota bacterium]
MQPTTDPVTKRLRAARLATLLTASVLASCGGSGGKARVPGVSGPPAASTLSVDFGLRRDFDLGTGFLGDVLHVDLNADGIEDLVETNFLPGQISIALGQPDGTFLPIATPSTLGKAWRLAKGDFDGDGMVDIAVASHVYRGVGASGLDVFLQGPTPGEFTQAPLRLTLATNPTDLAAAPASGLAGTGMGAPALIAGPDEIFLCLRDVGEVARVELQGGALVQTGSLESSNLGETGGPFSIAVVDLGSDGELDLVVGEERVPGQSDRVISYPRTNGAFGPAQMVMAPLFRPIVDNAGDMDSNGFEDIAIAQLDSNGVFLLRADASGLSQAVLLDFGAPTTSLIFPDLDGDGYAEAVATTLHQDSVQVLPGTGPMAWGEAVHYNVGPVPRAIDTILLPGDATPDLLCGNAQDLTVLVGIGNGEFRGARGYDIGAPGAESVLLADLDNDGSLDAVTVSKEGRAISFLRGDGQGEFLLETTLPLIPSLSEVPASAVASDVDLDGDLDVVVSLPALDEIRIYRNPGSIDSFSDPVGSDVISVEGGPIGLAVCDMDGDLEPDVVVANSTTDTVQVLLNQGGGLFAPQAGLLLGVTPQGLYAMDFDLDGDVDIAVMGADNSGYQLVILGGDGSGALAIDESHQIDGAGRSMVAGDFDEDGRPDLVVGQTSTHSSDFFLLMNEGGLSFNALRLTALPGPANVMAEDLDSDGHLDAVVATAGGELVVLFGDGQGGFPSRLPQTAGELPLGQSTVGASLGDLDGDSLPDLVTVSARTPFLWVARNTSTLSVSE